MALLEYILSKSMQGATVPPDSSVQEVSGVQAESVAEAPATESTPIAAVASSQDTPTEQADTSVPVEAPVNKWGYSDSDLAALSRNGYTPEELDYYNIGDYSPDKHGSYIKHIYEGTKTKPAELDEKKIRNAKMISGITDAVGLIGQMISVGRGAHARERDYESSALGRTEAKEKELRNIYKQELDKYESGLADAGAKDYLRGLDDFNARRKGIGGIVDANRKFEEGVRQVNIAQEQWEAEQERKKQDADRNYDLNVKKLTEQIRSNQASESIRRVNANKPSGKDKTHTIYVDASPDDTNASKNKFGQSVVGYDLSGDEMKNLASKLKIDKKFIDRHPELVLQRPTNEGTRYEKGSYQYADDLAFVRALAQELYDLQWKDSAGAQASPQSYSWSQPQWGEWIP